MFAELEGLRAYRDRLVREMERLGTELGAVSWQIAMAEGVAAARGGGEVARDPLSGLAVIPTAESAPPCTKPVAEAVAPAHQTPPASGGKPSKRGKGITADDVIVAHALGGSQADIARRLGVADATASYHLKKLGLTPLGRAAKVKDVPGSKPDQKNPVTPPATSKVAVSLERTDTGAVKSCPDAPSVAAVYRASGGDVKKMAKHLNCTPGTVRKCLVMYGIQKETSGNRRFGCDGGGQKVTEEMLANQRAMIDAVYEVDGVSVTRYKPGYAGGVYPSKSVGVR